MATGTMGNLDSPQYYAQQRSTMNPSAPMSQPGGIGVPDPSQPQPAAPPMASPDPEAIRRRLMGSVQGATDAAGAPYNAGFDQGVTNLYGTTAQKMAGYDESEGLINTNYEKNRGYQLQNQDADMKSLMDRMAFQGILSSGITTDQRASLGQNYAQKLDQLASAKAQALNQLSTQRLGTQSDYEQGLGGLESKYTSDLSNWVQQQAQQQAARQLQQTQDQANAALLAQFNQTQTAGNQQQLAILKQIAAAQGAPA